MIAFHSQEVFTSNALVLDVSGWEQVVVQFVNPTGTINITATCNNGGGGPAAATDFQTVQATKLADGTTVTAVAAAGLYRLGIVGRFIKFSGAAAAADGIYVSLFKSI